jgi:GH35 family endo-1,4-beta-xylanase
MRVKSSLTFINPEEYILSVLSPEDRLAAAFKIAKEAFKNSKLTMADIDNAVKTVRRKAYGKKK